MKIFTLIVVSLFMISCGLGSDTQSECKLSIIAITDFAGLTIMTSDVISNEGGVVDDKGMIILRADTYDPATYPTSMTDVTVDQVDIEYTRSDGKNTPGKDVPYPFSQPVTLRLAIGESGNLVAVFVRHIAKLEPPLIDLADAGQEDILYLNAKITVYSVDGAGNRLQPVSGSIQIQCGNFGG